MHILTVILDSHLISEHLEPPTDLPISVNDISLSIFQLQTMKPDFTPLLYRPTYNSLGKSGGASLIAGQWNQFY